MLRWSSMWVWLVAMTLSTTSIAWGKRKKPFSAPNEQQVQDGVHKAQNAKDVADKLRLASDAFVGAPYGISPLGEGSGEDADPRMRFDTFDCTTLVETSMALSMAKDVAEARRLLDVIRYQSGAVSFSNRRHFPGAEWLPQLKELGFLRDVTRTLAGDETEVATKTLNAQVWNTRKKPTVLNLPDARIPDVVVSLDVWPLQKARAGAKRIPPGTVLNLVRVDFKRIPVRVSHQGLVIEKNGKLYLRHAAQRLYHSVVDEPLDAFFARMEKYKKWPVHGVHLTQVQVPPNWRDLLPKDG